MKTNEKTENYARTWWRQIPSPSAWSDRLCADLRNGNSVCIPNRDTLPWPEYWSAQLENDIGVYERKMERTITSKSGDDPGDLLFNLFCKSDVRMRYRPGKSKARFLGERDDLTMHDRYIHVNNLTEEAYCKWAAFIGEYEQYRKGKNKAVFLLEMENDVLPSASKKGITVYDYRNSVHAFDILSWTSLMAGQARIREAEKPYLAEVVNSLCFGCMELAGRLIDRPTECLEQPLMRAARIIEEEFPMMHTKLESRAAEIALDLNAGPGRSQNNQNGQNYQNGSGDSGEYWEDDTQEDQQEMTQWPSFYNQRCTTARNWKNQTGMEGENLKNSDRTEIGTGIGKEKDAAGSGGSAAYDSGMYDPWNNSFDGTGNSGAGDHNSYSSYGYSSQPGFWNGYQMNRSNGMWNTGTGGYGQNDGCYEEDAEPEAPQYNPVLENALWKAQLKILYPAIEPYRSGIIQFCYRKIQRILNSSYNKFTNVSDPEEVEIGYLAKMISDKVLYVDRRHLNSYTSFRNARNRLAHMETVPYREVDVILDFQESEKETDVWL